MTLLSAQSIRRRCAAERPLITPFHERTVHEGKTFGLDSAGYDIRIDQTMLIRLAPMTTTQLLRLLKIKWTIGRYSSATAGSPASAIMDVPIETARHWFYRRLSSARRRELALQLAAECQRRGEELSRLEKWLLQRAGEL